MIENFNDLLPAATYPQFEHEAGVTRAEPCDCSASGMKVSRVTLSSMKRKSRGAACTSLQYIEKTREELDLALLAKIESTIHLEPNNSASEAEEEREID